MATRGRRHLAGGSCSGHRSFTRGGRGSRGQSRGAVHEDWVVMTVFRDIGVQLGEVHSHTHTPRLRNSLLARPATEKSTEPVVGSGSLEKEQFSARHVAVGCCGQGGEGAHLFDVHANRPLLGDGDHAMGARTRQAEPSRSLRLGDAGRTVLRARAHRAGTSAQLHVAQLNAQGQRHQPPSARMNRGIPGSVPFVPEAAHALELVPAQQLSVRGPGSTLGG
jgi:hypothetical protein